jgi:hypothetical protein
MGFLGRVAKMRRVAVNISVAPEILGPMSNVVRAFIIVASQLRAALVISPPATMKA